MLKQRLLTALVLIPLVLWSVFASNTLFFKLLLMLVAMLAIWEWLQMLKIEPITLKLAPLIGLVAVMWLSPSTDTLSLLMMLIWFAISFLVMIYASRRLPDFLERLFTNRMFGGAVAVILLSGFVLSAIWIHQSYAQGSWLVLYVLITVWLADTGGYFFGKKFGKKPLAKMISPNKTWEGVAGAMLLALSWSALFSLLIEDLNINLLEWFALTFIVVAMSIIGDLFESLFKRTSHIKDSGNLLPGHGGILDRVDSLLSAVPVFAGLLILLGA